MDPKPKPQTAFSTGNPRVDKLLSQMTIEEKISLLHGTGEDLAPASRRAGLLGRPSATRNSLHAVCRWTARRLRYIFAFHRNDQRTGIGGTFSTDDARANGVIIGRDARALGIDTVLEPTVNVARDPGGRGGGGEKIRC